MPARKSTTNTSAQKAAATRAKNREKEKRASEATGVMLVAAGILTAAYLFFSATGYLGEMLGKALFGLFGVISYALPVILIGVGVIYIRGSSSDRLAGSGWYMLLGILALVTLLQTIRVTAYEGVLYMDFINEALSVGQTAHMGGGFIGAVLSYPLLLLGGKTLSYILSIALIIVCAIAVTGLSIHDIGDWLTNRVVTAVENSQEPRQEKEEKPMFTLTLEDEVPAKTARSKKKGLPVETSGTGKRRTRKPSVQEQELQEFSGEFRTKTGAPPRRKAPQVVTPDFGGEPDFEPADDVPPVVAARKKSEPKKKIDLPDPTPLFGTQKAKTDEKPGPARQLGSKKPEAAAKTKTKPEVILPDAAYQTPSIGLLDKPDVKKDDESDSPEEKARILIDTLSSFRITAKVTHIAVGPALTRIEIQPAPGTRISRITALQGDLTMALAAPRLRMEAPIPGKNAIGIEIPNKRSALVVLRDIIESREFHNSASPVTMALGREASGKTIVADLTRMPHMLIAGATGSGKSVCINDIIISMVYKSSPADVRFILVDPKMVEMTMYGSLPHLLIPVVTEPKKAASSLRWAVREMERRYKAFSEVGARHMDRYNERVKDKGEHLPRIVIIIDELADLMMIAPDEVEDSIRRIAQLGRAAGIHLILATQRPDATVITGLIKANIPSRAAFAVSSATNSRIILDMGGAEKLLGHGDMLFHPDGSAKPTRLQCAYVSDEEVERIVAHFRAQTQHPVFDEQILEDVTKMEKSGPSGGAFGEGKQEDELLGEAVRVVLEHGQASTSMIQRRLRVGYSRASRLIDMMEQKGYISGFNGSKPRDVIIKKAQYLELFGDETPVADPPKREPNPIGEFYSEED
ncbi:MAG TPA: DNA translocase FtsK [Eubacteriales bacterium]|nr:DNA translocase FtsK [Eubacteriales bacterium]